MNFFKVGGFVRDAIIGVQSDDIDWAVEIESFDALRDEVIKRGGKIFLEREEFLTISAKMPSGLKEDFVICRSDSQSGDGRHPDFVNFGTILDDLARRDCTMNAIAMREDGSFYDPFGGIADIRAGIIRAVGNPADRIREDFLRMIRYIRFSITKGFAIDSTISDLFCQNWVWEGVNRTVSTDRVRNEVNKMIDADPIATMRFFVENPAVYNGIFQRGVRFIATTRQ